MPPLEVVREVNLRADGPRLAGVGLGDGLTDSRRGAGHVGGLDDLAATLGVDDDVRVGVVLADRFDVVLAEAFVNLTVPVPEDDVVVDGVGGVGALGVPGIPLDGLVGHAEPVGRVFTEGLSGRNSTLSPSRRRIRMPVRIEEDRPDRPARHRRP